MMDEIDAMLARVINAIKNAPVKRGKMYIAVDERAYALLQFLEEWDMIEFTFHDTVPHEPVPLESNSLWMKSKLYILSIDYTVSNGFIFIKKQNGDYIVWR